MDKKSSAPAAFVLRRVLFALFLYAAACLILTGTLLAFFRSESATNASQGSLTFAERVAWQGAIEDVYWRHRIWPRGGGENLNPKPSLDAVMSQAQLRKKVADYLRESEELEDHWQRTITAEDLQTEMDRMARDTKRPEVLRELFDALGNDPFVIAECLARPLLSERLITTFAQEGRRHGLILSEDGANIQTRKVTLADAKYVLPTISDVTTGCTPDTWTPTSVPNAPPGRFEHTAVWTGSEMIVWGGARLNSRLNTGGRYDPATDSWTKTSNTNAPTAREFHTAVWTGSEMIVWGGCSDAACNTYFNTGGRYNPSTDTWTATSTANVPDGRWAHTAVWTGSEMIVWGGVGQGVVVLNTGGRYDVGSDSWTATTTTDAPSARDDHTAVWTGSEMIVWGGSDGPVSYFNTGARYDPNTDNWIATSTTNVPVGRASHTAVWTGSEMIVWGGYGNMTLNTGGRYDVGSDSWTATTITNAPSARQGPRAVWTGSEMIVWGGEGQGNVLNTGGRYDVGSDSWTATTTTDAPSARAGHTAVWTGSEMIIWGGAAYGSGTSNTGGRYCAQSGSPTPTPTATPTSTVTATPTATTTPTPTSTVSPTPTATARPSPTPRIAPTPRPRPTPPPRP